MNFLEILGKDIENIRVPWIQKYTPKTLSEIVGNTNVINSFQYYVNNQNIPNLIITGPNGTGKQTAVKAILYEYLGTYQKQASRVIYGSISRSKDVVSEKYDQKKDNSYDGPNVINFINRKISLPSNMCKIIVIYDFNKMTNEAQNALNRVIELYSNRVRFILTCTQIKNVSEAIQSRCVVAKFTLLTDNEVKKVLEKLTKLENIQIPNDVIDIICLSAYGDLKQSINYLQVLSRSKNINLQTFYNIFNMPPIKIIKEIIYSCLSNKPENTYQKVNTLLKSGYNVNDILNILVKIITKNQFEYNPKIKSITKNGQINKEIQLDLLRAINHCYYLGETLNSNCNLFNLISHFIKANQHNLKTKFQIY